MNYSTRVIGFSISTKILELVYRDARPMFWSVAQKRPIYEDEINTRYEPKPGIFIKYKITGRYQLRLTNSIRKK